MKARIGRARTSLPPRSSRLSGETRSAHGRGTHWHLDFLMASNSPQFTSWKRRVARFHSNALENAMLIGHGDVR